MSVLRDFTEAMTQYEKSKGIPSGYRVGNNAPYRYYMSNEAWNAMRNGMSDAVEKQYGAGSGGELEEKNENPPKMAAYHSSSRMIYLLSKDIDGFEFEKKLSTIVGGIANLDGYRCNPQKTIYVEAKCREPYAHPVPEKINNKYIQVYEYLREKMPQVFDYKAEPVDERNQSVTFYCHGAIVKGFDIKQMICHLLAVAGSLLTEQEIPEQILFLYLIFDPTVLPLKTEGRERVLEVYQRTLADARNLDMESMFGHVIDYLTNKDEPLPGTHADALKNAFRFELCSQKDYLSKF